MKWFGKPKCFLCDTKIIDLGGELKYTYDDNGVKKLGTLPICTNCSNTIEYTKLEDNL